MIRTALLFFIITLSFNNSLSAQITQTIRGVVVDEASLSPLSGVKVRVVDTTQTIGAITDFDGEFKLVDVPIGRITLVLSLLGYEQKVIPNLDLTSGKELVLNITLTEEYTTTEEITVSRKKKGEVQNEMASVSARTFSVEASQRYAGSVNDVARMAQNFAGVQGNDDSRNDIIVRGNSPIGVLYRYEGVDIPNPNHFALLGTAGGPVSILNNNVLANSDFFTGAFPAEYGNALAAVFDLKMRNGNNEKHEFLGQIGFNGAEFMAEGPISREKKSSYLLSYRYSTLQLFALMGVNFGSGTAVPIYQDVNFKLNFKNKKGSTSIFGLGGISNVEFEGEEEDGSNNFFTDDLEDLFFYSRIGVLGVKNIYRFNEKTYLKTTVSTSATYNSISRDSLILPDFTNYPTYRNASLEGKNNINTQVNYKANSRNLIRAGIVADRLFFNLSDSIRNPLVDETNWFTLTNYEGATYVVQPFAQWQFKATKKLTLNTGIHHQVLTLNGSSSLEPRIGLRYQAKNRHGFGLGYGKHAQVPPNRIYFRQITAEDGSIHIPNRNIGMTKAHHFVGSYDFKLTEYIQLKTEVYYQSLYNVPVDVQPNSYSLLNFGASFTNTFPDTLQNSGTGQNYGIEITLEHFMKNGTYFLFTGSFYESTYEGSNGQEFGTAFNGNYTANLLGGKEFVFKSKVKEGKTSSSKSLLIDGRASLNGGQRFTPVDETASVNAGVPIYDYSRTNASQYPNYFRIDLRIAFRVSKPKFTQEWAIDFRNLTNHQNIFTQNFNPSTGAWESTYQIGFLPIGQWRIMF